MNKRGRKDVKDSVLSYILIDSTLSKKLMKILSLLTCVLCFVYSDILAQEPTFSEDLQFKERVFDFGEIEEQNGIVYHEFEFKNAGQKATFISGVTSGCGCVRFEYPKEVIRPNGTGKVKVGYNPAYRPGFFSKEIVVLTNDNANYTRIWVKGTVKPCDHPVSEDYPYEYGNGLWMNFKTMTFGTIGVGKEKTMKLKFANDTDKDMDLMFVVVGGNTDIKFTSPRLLKAHEKGEMPVTYQYSGNFPTETRIYPVINGKALMNPLKVTCIHP